MSTSAVRRAWRELNREKLRAQSRARRAKNKEAHRAYQLAWRAKNRAKIRAQQAERRRVNAAANKQWQRAYRESERGRRTMRACLERYYAVPMNRVRLLVNGAIWRSRKTGMECSPNLLQVLSRDLPLLCPCCSQPLDYAMGHYGRNEAVPSLDRVDNSRGYTIDNTVIVCRRCNRMKGEATADDLRRLIQYIERHSARSEGAQARADARADESAARAAEREAALRPPESGS